MILLLDIGNTTTHPGLLSANRVTLKRDFPTELWLAPRAPAPLSAMLAGKKIKGVCFCSVVPDVVPAVKRFIQAENLEAEQLTSQNFSGVELRYPRPRTLGADRLANILAASRLYGEPGSPLVCVDFGTAVTLDALDARGRFVGGIIAPGLAALRDYLREKTAQLPRVDLTPPRRYIGRGTKEAMRVGCVCGFEGMMRGLLEGARRELGEPAAKVVATGGYARRAAARLPEISVVRPGLTLEGLGFFWHARRGGPSA